MKFLKNIIYNLKIGTRTSLSFFAIIFVALATAVSAIILLQYSKNIDKRITGNFTTAIDEIKNLHYIVQETERLTDSWVKQPEKDKKLKLEKILDKHYRRQKVIVIEYTQQPELTRVRNLVISIDKEFQGISDKSKQIMQLLQAEADYADTSKIIASKQLLADISFQMKKLEQLNSEAELNAIDAMRKLNLQKYASYRTLSYMLIAMLIVLIVVSALSLVITNHTVIKPIKEISEVLDEVGKGETVKYEPERTRKDEIGMIIDSMQSMVKGLKAKADVANAIGRGDYDVEVLLQSKSDRLGRALVEMRNNLKNSQIKEAEQMRALADYTLKVEKKNKELDQFAYITSHDLKAPLRAINNLSEWIEEDLADQMSIETKRNFELLRGRVHRLESLINSLLKYSKAGQIEGEVEKIDTKKLVNVTLLRINPPANFAIYYDENLPVVEGYRKDMEDVFYEYISNAVKYNQGDEPIVNVTCTTEGDMYKFCVADNGPGIAPEFHNRIFTIFQTLEARDKLETMGAGLAIVRKIAEENGGKAWVESALGEGARFYFTWKVNFTRDGVSENA